MRETWRDMAAGWPLVVSVILHAIEVSRSRACLVRDIGVWGLADPTLRPPLHLAQLPSRAGDRWSNDGLNRQSQIVLCKQLLTNGFSFRVASSEPATPRQCEYRQANGSVTSTSARLPQRPGDEMTIDDARACLQRLLDDKANQVVALTGRWGTGKTFMWNQVREKSADSAVRDAISVSLFGVADISQLKAKIVQVVISNASTKPKLIESAMPWIEAGRKLLGPFVLGKNATVLNDLVALSAPAFLKDKVIAIDDIERKHANLSVDEALGFIDECTQKYKCRIVLILNSDKLKDKPMWEVMREKVVDAEIRLETTPSEAFDIALTLVDTRFSAEIRLACAACGICNIRILKKIIVCCNRILTNTARHTPELLGRVVPPICLLAALHFKGIDDGPDIAFVLRGGTLAALAEGQNVAGDEARWGRLLSDLSIYYPDDFERQVIACLESGFLESQDLSEELERLSREADRTAAQNELSRYVHRVIWHHQLSPGELAEQARDVVAKSTNLGATSLTTLHGILLELDGGEVLARGLFQDWIAANAARENFDWERERRSDDVHPDLLAAIDAEYVRRHQAVPIVDTVIQIAQLRALGERHVAGLRATSIDSYTETIRSLDPDQLQPFMRAAVHLAQNNWGNATIARSMEQFVSACQGIVDAGPNSRLGALLNKIIRNAGLGRAADNGEVQG